MMVTYARTWTDPTWNERKIKGVTSSGFVQIIKFIVIWNRHGVLEIV